jgi:hypothetical protein
MANRLETKRASRSWWFWLLLLLLLLLLFILAYFLGPWSPDRRVEYLPEDFFIQDQLIVSGPEMAVTAAIAALPAGTVEQQERLELSRLVGASACPGLRSRAPGDGNLVIDLYQMTAAGGAVRELISQIEALAGQEVTAEPNWLSGSPWEIEGSPWEIEGSSAGDGKDATAGRAEQSRTVRGWTRPRCSPGQRHSTHPRFGR